MRANAYRLIAIVFSLVIVAIVGTRLVAPGPPAFYVEPNTRMVLVAIEPGTFVMGSPDSEAGRNADETPHRVTLSKRFYMGRFEVTQTEWQQVMGSAPSHFQGCSLCPVETVNFYDVDEFITKLNARSVAMRFRLPTEAEWEYACRAGTTTAYAFGNRLTIQDANFLAAPVAGETITPGVGPYRTRTVGSYHPNAWGLHDMHGNVWEWTNDFYGPYDTNATVNPRGRDVGPRRVIRGGSWYFDAASARCALRYTHEPEDRGFSLGFRVLGEPVEGAR